MPIDAKVIAVRWDGAWAVTLRDWTRDTLTRFRLCIIPKMIHSVCSIVPTVRRAVESVL